MNKRYYEHTLPIIRGSLSNTYVYLSMRGQGEEGFSRYISNNVRFHTASREFVPDH
jgi:hypothetical protein